MRGTSYMTLVLARLRRCQMMGCVEGRRETNVLLDILDPLSSTLAFLSILQFPQVMFN